MKIIKINFQTFPLQEEEEKIPFEIARLSAEVAANIITTTKLSTLGDCCITNVFNGEVDDEAIVNSVRMCYRPKNAHLPRLASTNHVVAAAVMEASSSGADIENLFQIMKKYLIQAQSKI